MIAFEIAVIITACVYVTLATLLMIKELKTKEEKQKKIKKIKTPEEVLFDRAIRLRNVDSKRQLSQASPFPVGNLIDKRERHACTTAPTYCKEYYEQAKIHKSQK